MEEAAAALGFGLWISHLPDVLVFGRIEGKKEEHSGVYECVYKTSPVIKGQVNISGNLMCLLLALVSFQLLAKLLLAALMRLRGSARILPRRSLILLFLLL